MSLKLQPNDYYVIEGYPNIWGKVIKTYGKDRFLVEAFSSWCPDGEGGLMHISEPTRKISQQEFEQAKARLAQGEGE